MILIDSKTVASAFLHVIHLIFKPQKIRRKNSFKKHVFLCNYYRLYRSRETTNSRLDQFNDWPNVSNYARFCTNVTM